MIREINRDTFSLQQPSSPATKADLAIGQDLQDTLRANRDRCVGMAANMIGVHKRIIIVNMGVFDLVMYNPVLLKKAKPYQTQEGCLSLIGERAVTRYEEITVSFKDGNWQEQTLELTGFTAQIVQHELDHLEGVLI